VNLTDDGIPYRVPGCLPLAHIVQEGTLPHTEISSGSRLRIVAKLREHQFILEKRGPGLYLSIQSKD
jgi:hypothetical protein